MEVQREPDIVLGGKPYYIHYVGVDKKTGEAVTGIRNTASISQERWDEFAKGLGFVRVDKENEKIRPRKSEGFS